MSAVTNRTSRAFPSPYEVPPPDGCDGYREMYPYYLTFCEERRELDERRFWLLDRTRYPEPVLPFQLVTAESSGAAAGRADSRTFEVPVRPADERRVLNGFVYVSLDTAADPAEVELRGLQLLPQVGGYLRRWEELYGEWAGRVERSIAGLRDLDVPDLPEFEDEAVVTEGRGITSEHRLLVAYDGLLEGLERTWRYQVELVDLAHAAQLAFTVLCRRHLPGVSEQDVVQMVAGTADGERLTAENRRLLSDAESGRLFDESLGLARVVFPYREGHNSPVEDSYLPLFWDRARELGALLRRNRFFEEADDVFYLRAQEVQEALLDLRISWADGGRPAGGRHWKPIVAGRKAVLERFRSWFPPPALGPAPDPVSDATMIGLWGVSPERLNGWLDGASSEGALTGSSGAPGVAEGPVRVVLAVQDLGQLREGEILVAPVAAPGWAPAFDRADGAVTDVGGVMSEAAALARERGLPAVVGTGFATAALRTGQKVRVDGDRGVVTLLDA